MRHSTSKMVARVSFVVATTISDFVFGQAFHAKPIKLISAGVPGSVTDVIARPLAERLAVQLGKAVIVEHHPGAGGILAMQLVAKASPDGHTLGVATTSQLVFNSYLFARLPYHPLRDFEPVANLVAGQIVAAAHPSFRADSLSGLVSLARARPGTIHYAVPQIGSPPHVFALMIIRDAAIDMSVVPFHRATDALASVLGGDVPVIFDAPVSVAQHVKAGRLKALAVTGSERHPLLPDTPTLAEQGLERVRGQTWIGLVAPARTPAEIVKQLNREVVRALRAPDMKRY